MPGEGSKSRTVEWLMNQIQIVKRHDEKRITKERQSIASGRAKAKADGVPYSEPPTPASRWAGLHDHTFDPEHAVWYETKGKTINYYLTTWKEFISLCDSEDEDGGSDQYEDDERVHTSEDDDSDAKEKKRTKGNNNKERKRRRIIEDSD